MLESMRLLQFRLFSLYSIISFTKVRIANIVEPFEIMKSDVFISNAFLNIIDF